MNDDLLREPNDNERKLIDVVMEDHINRDGAWPIWQYVEAMLFQQHHLEAAPILAGAPRVAVRQSIGSYGWFRSSSTLFTSPQSADIIGLSVSGMARSNRGHPDVGRFVALLRYLCERQRTFSAQPDVVQKITVTSEDIREALSSNDKNSIPREARPWLISDGDLLRLSKLIGEEPSTWSCAVTADGDGFVVEVAPFIRPYHGVTDIEDYIKRLVAEIAPKASPAELNYPHGLALPEAIDYLNAVWREHSSTPLINIPRAEAAARLAFTCTSAEQFDSQLSGLCQLLDALTMPDGSNAKLHEFDSFLNKHLPDGGYQRAHEAIVTLRSLFTLRAWRQHAADDRSWREAAQRLGVTLPTADWNDAWRRLHLATIDALGTIREEFEGLAD
ncbi:MAG: hypothetical protein ACYDB2_07170 [Acidimicrobiales bacterium]